MLMHAATLLLSVGDLMGFNSPEQFTKHSFHPVDGGERKFSTSSTSSKFGKLRRRVTSTSAPL